MRDGDVVNMWWLHTVAMNSSMFIDPVIPITITCCKCIHVSRVTPLKTTDLFDSCFAGTTSDSLVS